MLLKYVLHLDYSPSHVKVLIWLVWRWSIIDGLRGVESVSVWLNVLGVRLGIIDPVRNVIDYWSVPKWDRWLRSEEMVYSNQKLLQVEVLW
jgi:hypothetical protein